MGKTRSYRIIDHPNHPSYGPIRRMWVILIQLDLIKNEDWFEEFHGLDWETMLCAGLKRLSESKAQQDIIRCFFALR